MSDENTDISSRDWARRRWATHPLDGASANRFRCRSVSIVLLAVAWMAMPLAATAACNDYTFEFRAEPSFIAPSVIRVQTRPRSARLSIEIGNKYKEALVLDRAMAQAFCERLKQALAIEQSNESSIGLDGIQVQGNFKEAASPQVNFSFWSPDKARQPRDFAVVDSIFSLLE